MSSRTPDTTPATPPASAEERRARRAESLARFIEESGGIDSAERRAASQVTYRRQLPFLAIGMTVVMLSYFLPHTAHIFGYDVLLYTPDAEAFNIRPPERAYTWLALIGGVLLTAATIFTRKFSVLWVNWALCGIGWWYSIFAIWVRQSRPASEIEGAPAFGLVLGSVAMTVLFITLSSLLISRTPLQRALAARRREQAHESEASRAAQQRLRTGLAPLPEHEIVDDRRERARKRRERRGSSATPGSTESNS